MWKLVVVFLGVFMLSGCTFQVQDTRTPEVRATEQAFLAENPHPIHPSIEVSLFPTDTPENLVPTVTPTPVCLDIKGNISASGEKIYHVPGQANYNRTLIDKEGEAFFCTETEAVEAGFRKAQR